MRSQRARSTRAPPGTIVQFLSLGCRDVASDYNQPIDMEVCQTMSFPLQSRNEKHMVQTDGSKVIMIKVEGIRCVPFLFRNAGFPSQFPSGRHVPPRLKA